MSHINLSREDFEKLLMEKFPIIYRDMHGDMKRTCMAWGCDISKGWYDILYNLSKKLEAIANDQPLDLKNNPEYDGADTRIVLAQVKEKFGQLRIYMDNWPEDHKQIEGLIREAEQQSSKVCDQCGNPGKTRSGGWMLTLCDIHHEENQRRIAMRDVAYAWDVELKPIRHLFIIYTVDGTEADFDAWETMSWKDLSHTLQDVLAPKIQGVINALRVEEDEDDNI